MPGLMMADDSQQLELFTTTKEETQLVACELKDIGCCVRCTLRFLGLCSPSSYNESTEYLNRNYQLGRDSSVYDVTSYVCPACLGILQRHAERPFLNKLKQKVEDDGYEFLGYQCSLLVPVSLIVRHKAICCHLQRKFSGIFSLDENAVPAVKEVWKWSTGPTLTLLLNASFHSRSPFDILLTFDYIDSEKECTFLLDVFPETFRRRKQRKYGFETFTRANVTQALSEMSPSNFEDCCPCPPPLPIHQATCAIKCSHDSVFIAGRYQKYSRTLSQTPWISDGKRVMEGSVEEIICNPMNEMIKPSEMRLSSSGREDVDVRMLGLGRPFVIELVDPHRVKLDKDNMKGLQEKINSTSSDVQVRDIQLITREDTNKLKEGEIDKTKSYSALCWCERELTQEDVDMLANLKDLTLQQKTPLRVLHRRTAMTRERVIHSIGIRKESDNRFQMKLITQAGTYVKEFVHGDFGRTVPNMSKLLNSECDILSLDVDSVDVDWPPYIDEIPEKSMVNETVNDNLGDKV